MSRTHCLYMSRYWLYQVIITAPMAMSRTHCLYMSRYWLYQVIITATMAMSRTHCLYMSRYWLYQVIITATMAKNTIKPISVNRFTSASRHQVLVPHYQLSSLGRQSFAVAGPMTWNSLSADLRDLTCSNESFRRSVKTFLFAKY